MSTLSDFATLVEELIDMLKILKIIEENKLRAISEKNLTDLDACMKDEQVNVMRLKGLEKNREKIQADLGYDNMTFKQIIDKTQGTEKSNFQSLFNELEKATNEFKKINNSVKTALEVNIHKINSMIDKANQPSTAKTNKAPGGRISGTNRFA